MRIRTTHRILAAAAKEIAPNVVHSDYIEAEPANIKAGEHWFDDEIVEYDDLTTIAFEGPVQFNLNGWVSRVERGVTYGDILRIFARGLSDLGDEHHVFYEGWAQGEVVNNVLQVNLHSGS